MAMTEAFRHYLMGPGNGVEVITHIGLVNGSGDELSGGSYARVAVTWAAASGGFRRPNANLTFNVPAGVVAGWRGFTASSGGTNYGGEALTEETFAEAGQYTLLAASTGIQLRNPA